MKLFYSPNSPYARKCLVVALELGLRERIETLPGNASPTRRDPDIAAKNPLSKVPTLVADDGTVLFDSPVIAEYLNALGGGKLIPPDGPARWNVLVEQALGDGILDAALLARYEIALRPENLRWSDWTSGQLDKVGGGLDEVERRAARFGDRVDLGTIALACMLGYIDFRFAHLEWRSKRPDAAAWFERFAARESMMKTAPPG
ncbi:MAG TPA: glutathione S-transferase N-terminal domain-containing protein [Casimicrobiaceae bacterium]|nr:glutathione S-transferase N-terminal domain-containing protein [Casimicrobiaceae bacterium]